MDFSKKTLIKIYNIYIYTHYIMYVDKIKPSRDNIYLNTVIQPIASNGADNTLALYNETLTQSILGCASDYYCSVIRFSLPIDSIPLFKFPVDVNQNNPNVSYLTIGINVGGILYSRDVIYVPSNSYTAPTPALSAPFFTNAQSTGQYYDMFSIQNMLTMINAALNLAHIASGTPGASPYYFWNSDTELISLYVTKVMVLANERIYVNRYLKNYLSAYNYYFDAGTKSQEYLYSLQYHPIPPSDIAANVYEYKQEYVSIALWMDIRKIIIQSNTLPIATEALPNQITTQIAQLPDFSGLNSYSPIISDFVLSYDNVNQISSVVVYNPSAQYRLVDMIGNNPINKIDLQFFYQDKFGNKFPIYFSPSNEVSVKLGFFKKALYVAF